MSKFSVKFKTIVKISLGTFGLYAFHDKIAGLIMCTGPSMTPTIDDKDILLCESISTTLGRIQRGDIVICLAPVVKKNSSKTEDDSPNVVGQRETLCKRVVGLSGDWIAENGLLFQISKGYIWIEGDNPKNSWDSRHFGPVPITNLKRKCLAKISPRIDVFWARKTCLQKPAAEDTDSIIIILN